MRKRSVGEVRAAGDTCWFAPALARWQALLESADAELRTFFSPESPRLIARAPGRLDVMGGIADYSGALVLELPLACSTSAILQMQADPRIDLISFRDGQPYRFGIDLEPLIAGDLREPAALSSWFAERESDRWASYVIGLVHACLQRMPRPAAQPIPGFRLCIESQVPEGKGVSSSAALEVACMAVIAAAYGVEMTAPEIAAACQWVENHIAGAPCGIMDQMTSACGQRDRLLRLRCQPGIIEGHVRVPAGYRFYGIDSGVRHAVTGADYGTVRTAAFMGYRMIADAAGLPVTNEGDRVRVADPRWRGYLANLTPAEFSRFADRLPERMSGTDFLERYAGTTDTVTQVQPDGSYPVRQATAHPVYEQARITRFAELLGSIAQQPETAVEMGRLMYASHASYGACGLGSEGTDRLVEMIAEVGAAHGLFGAKITGGGSGGTVAVFGTEAAEARVREIAARYSAETGRSAVVFTGSGPGAAETGILEIPGG